MYPSFETSTLTVPSSISLKVQPPALSVVLVSVPILTLTPSIGGVLGSEPSLIVKDIFLVIGTVSSSSSLVAGKYHTHTVSINVFSTISTCTFNSNQGNIRCSITLIP